ncbi:hypothetical protein H5410_023760, partial [Solanum commersonii]
MFQYVVEKISARDVWLELEKICCHNSLDNFQAKITESTKTKKDYKYYLPLYNASLCGDWENAKAFLKKDNAASRAHITSLLQTTLHISIGSKKDGNARFFIENLVNSITDDDTLAIQDKFGETPLHYAARFGNLDAAKILVTRNLNLPHIVSNNGMYPIHVAAEYGYKNVDLVHYLFSVTKYSAPYTDRSGDMLLHRLICSDLYDFAMQLVKLYPDLAKYSSHRSSPLAQLATKTFGTSSPLKLFIYSCIAASELEYIRDKKWKHQNAIKLAECLCEELQNISEKEISSIVGGPLLQATHFDNYKLVEIIVTKFPSSIYYHHENEKNILHVAVENRSKNVFKLVSQMNQHSHHLVTSIDSSNNTMLHLAGKLSEEKELKKTFGAALNMQEELRWFEAVKQILPPSYYLTFKQQWQNCSSKEDFSYVFPKRLLCGLLMLYASVEAMMLSFGCALYFVLKDSEMVFYVVFIVVVLLPILAFQHWREMSIVVFPEDPITKNKRLKFEERQAIADWLLKESKEGKLKYGSLKQA